MLYSWRSVGGAPGLPDGKGTWRGGNLETLSADGNDTSAKSRRVLIPWGKLERLAQTSADLHLGIGEFAVHEGGERALYAVLAAKMEVVKLVDGIERTLGWRVPGNIFGEVPIALGTPFPGGYRASEPSRVIRVDVQQYYEVAAVSPKIAEKIGALARERIGGLQGLAAEPPKARVTMVGHRWDTSCSRLRHFLASNHITYDWMTPDAPEMPARWSGSRPADDECPVLKFVDGTLLSRPGARDVAQHLGLQTNARFAEYDTLIIGGGPAGLAAAVYGASEGLRTVVVDVSGPRFWSHAVSLASIRRRVRFTSTAVTCSWSGPSSSPLA